MRRVHRLAAAGLIAVSAVATAQGPRLAVFAAVQPGNWQLHEFGSTAPSRAICVRDPTQLLQIRHAGSQCAHVVIADAPTSATISYTCPALGNGRTSIRVESSSILRLQTQGIAGGAPFDMDYEARRTGPCNDPR